MRREMSRERQLEIDRQKKETAVQEDYDHEIPNELLAVRRGRDSRTDGHPAGGCPKAER
jgi:hypothetical protein